MPVNKFILTALWHTGQHICLALAFSSRLPLPQSLQAGPDMEPDMAAAFVWLPLAGAILTLFACLPFLCGLFSSTWLAAWFWLLVYLWLGRGLHWDGLADVADGLGSGKKGTAFWQTVKDSRLGAMGVISLFLAGAGYLLCVQALLEAGRWGALPWAAALGRAFALTLPAVCPVHPQSELGKAAQSDRLPPRMALWGLFLAGLGFFCFSLTGLCLAFGAGLLFIRALAAAAARQGGFNGDFIGAAIVLTELAALFMLAAAA